MELKFYFVRHGKTLFNLKGRMQGWCDSPLLDEGIQQAENVASALRNVPFNRAYCSTSERAWDTAKKICKYHDIPLTLTKGLKEFSFGSLDGARKEEVLDSPFFDDWSAEGGETNSGFAQRVRTTMQGIVEESRDGDTILLVGHGAYAVRILEILFGMNLDDYVERCKAQDRWLMPNTGMLIFHYKDGKFFLDQEPINVNEYRQIYHPKTIDIYLMRHGETRFNVQERMQGRCDSPLTEKGIQEAKEAAEKLKDIPFSTIYVSTAERARDTAEIIAQYHPGNIVYSKKICEVNYGDLEGMTFKEADPSGKRFMDTHYGDVGGEEYNDVTKRMNSIFHEIYDTHQDQDKVLLVSHGDFYLVCLEALFGLKKEDIFQEASELGINPVPNCGIAHFRMTSNQYELIQKMSD